MEGGGGRDRKRGRETWRGRGRRRGRGRGIVRGEGEGEETEKEKGTLLHRLDAAAFEGGDALPLAAVLHVRARLAHPGGGGGGGGGGGFACGPWRRRRWRHERHVVHPPAALAPHLRRGGSLCTARLRHALHRWGAGPSEYFVFYFVESDF